MRIRPRNLADAYPRSGSAEKTRWASGSAASPMSSRDSSQSSGESSELPQDVIDRDRPLLIDALETRYAGKLIDARGRVERSLLAAHVHVLDVILVDQPAGLVR